LNEIVLKIVISLKNVVAIRLCEWVYFSFCRLLQCQPVCECFSFELYVQPTRTADDNRSYTWSGSGWGWGVEGLSVVVQLCWIIVSWTAALLCITSHIPVALKIQLETRSCEKRRIFNKVLQFPENGASIFYVSKENMFSIG
jgi:hypothetical protein